MKIKHLLGSLFAACGIAAMAHAQEASTGGSALSVDSLASLTNHDELVGHMFKKVEGVLVSFTDTASANSSDPQLFFAYTNEVKSLQDIMGVITNWWVNIPTLSTSAPVSISVAFYDSADQNAIMGYVPSEKGSPASPPTKLFEGYNGGIPIRDQYGQLVLPEYAERIQMSLASGVYVAMTNVVTARIVYTNAAGQYISQNLAVDYLRGFSFPSDLAGNAVVVIGSYQFTDNGVYYAQHAYSLSAGAQEVPIDTVLVRALIGGSDDIAAFSDTYDMSVHIYSYIGYGKVPMVMATCSHDQTAYLSITDQVGNQATSFIIEDEATGIRTTVAVPQGQQGVQVTLPKGVYYIYSRGLDLKPWETYAYGPPAVG
ncbi:MAG: hypothetical protein KGI69_03520 [Patescibacteria group bacterium]|nr:hypothetical protein [Patescibacteria group bacterium]